MGRISEAVLPVSAKAIADPRFGNNVLRRIRNFYLFTELPDVDTNVLGAVLVQSPHILKNHTMGEQLSCMFCEADKQIELQWREPDNLTPHSNTMLCDIDAKITDR